MAVRAAVDDNFSTVLIDMRQISSSSTELLIFVVYEKNGSPSGRPAQRRSLQASGKAHCCRARSPTMNPKGR